MCKTSLFVPYLTPGLVWAGELLVNNPGVLQPLKAAIFMDTTEDHIGVFGEMTRFGITHKTHLSH